MTVADVLNLTLRDLGVLGAGEVAAAEDAADGLLVLNDWIDALKTEGLTVYSLTRTVWVLTGATSYTIGTGGTINVDRPVSPKDIANIGYVDTSVTPNAEFTQGPPLTEDDYQSIVNKTLTSPIPAAWYYNPTFPLGTLKPFPVPNGAYSGVIYTPANVAEFTATSDTISLPPGYRQYFRDGLKIRLAPTFHVPVTADMKEAFSESRANVKRANQRLVDVDLSEVAAMFSGSGPSNVYTGN
jgi:hypothetical protein